MVSSIIAHKVRGLALVPAQLKLGSPSWVLLDSAYIFADHSEISTAIGA
jgi:hypothetical protein